MSGCFSPFHAERRQQMSELFRAGKLVPDIAADLGLTKPTIYRSLRQTGDLPPYRVREGRLERHAPRVQVPADIVRVDRDPCSYCGVRLDVGCKHTVRG